MYALHYVLGKAQRWMKDYKPGVINVVPVGQLALQELLRCPTRMLINSHDYKILDTVNAFLNMNMTLFL